MYTSCVQNKLKIATNLWKESLQKDFRPKCGAFSSVQYKLIQKMQISQRCIFRILQDFAAKLCNFTNLNMLFLAGVMHFVRLA
jgi:hypothetical protein